jgi:hypothetical protein
LMNIIHISDVSMKCQSQIGKCRDMQELAINK